jgi:hypothetical protein
VSTGSREPSLGAKVNFAVYRAILRKRDDEVFQTKDIREDCRWEEGAPEARRMHAVIQALKADHIIAQSGPERKRHQYLTLKNRAALQARLARLRDRGQNGKVVSAPLLAPTGPQRVRDLEDRLLGLEQVSADQEGKLTEILATLNNLATKIDELHREWVTV